MRLKFIWLQYEMLFILRVLSLCVFLFRCSYCSRYFMKPSFPNYCETKDKCKPACNCEVYPNCSLLSMDETVRKTILFYHNQIRDIQSAGEPQPSGMTMLQYDMQLEEISKCWAARCDNEYSVCFKSPRFQETSQSVGGLILEGEESPNVFLWLQMMSYWLGQAEVVTAKAIHSLPADQKHESMHNFAQLMSDNVLSVGCAWSILTTDNWLIFVCTYGPRGPQQGESIYRTGYPCSHCPEDYACDYVKPFERLCKPTIEAPKPPASYTPYKQQVKSQEQEERREISVSPPQQRPDHGVPRQQSPLEQNSYSNRNFDGPPIPEPPTSSSINYPVYRTSAELPPEHYSAPPFPQRPQSFVPQAYPQHPPMPAAPFQPTTSHQDVPRPSFSTPAYYPQLTSTITQQLPQYIPQPPPLPRLPLPFTQPPEMNYVPRLPPFPQPSQSDQFRPQPTLPPPHKGENVQNYYNSQPRQPILPPPPQESFEQPVRSQFDQAVLSYRIPDGYFPNPVRSNISPQIPQPPPIDSPPLPEVDSRFSSPPDFYRNIYDSTRSIPNYDVQNKRSFISGLKPYFRYPEVAMQTSPSVPLQRREQSPPQLSRAIILPHAEPLPPPLSYFPPQPPPLPRGQSEYPSPSRNEGISPMPPPLPNLPPPPLRSQPIQPPPRGPMQPPPRQITSLAQQKPEPSQFSYSIQPYEISENPKIASDVPLSFPPSSPPEQSRSLPVGRKQKERKVRAGHSNGFHLEGSLVLIISNHVFILKIM